MDARISHDTKCDGVRKEANKYLQDQGCSIWKKALQYTNIRREGLLEIFQGGIDFADWTEYINKKLSLWSKLSHGTNPHHGGPLIFSLRMAHVSSDKNEISGRNGERTITQGHIMRK